MRLSEAIILGDSALRRSPSVWLNRESGCGCALGRAYYVAGGEKDLVGNCIGVIDGLTEMWPFLTKNELQKISMMFFTVCGGGMTIEALADYVKTLEPAEMAEEVSAEEELVGA